jgi:hypothetical protein
MIDDDNNYFIIERLDKDSESDNLKNIYDLSILDHVKEVKYNKKSKINVTKKISQKQKESIIQVVKKTILSANLTYKWKLETFKAILVFFHLFIFISGIASNIKNPNKESFLSMYLHNLHPIKKIEYNITYNITEEFNNNSTNNFTNNTQDFSTNFSDYNKTNINNKKLDKKFVIFASLFNQMLLIPLWIIFFNRYIPKWKEVNDILFKITNYLLYCESLTNKKYYFSLLKNYSILVVRKKCVSNYKKLPDELKAQNSLTNYLNHNKVKIKKNMFLYCINIINDFVLEDFATINYHQLISNSDSEDINILIKYMESSLYEKLKKFIKKILIPISLLTFISIYNIHKISNVLFTFLSIFIFVNMLIGKYILKEYYQSYKKNIDKFIENFNMILIQKNRFIYRKNRLIMFFALRNNHYAADEIINAIKKIIA